MPTSVNGTQITGTNNFLDGYRLGMNARMEKRNYFVQSDLGFSSNFGGGTTHFIDNWNNPNNTSSLHRWQRGQMHLLNMVDFSVTGGFKVFKVFRPYIGLGFNYTKVKEPNDLFLYENLTMPDGTINETTIALNDANRFNYAIQESYLPFVMTQKIGLNMEIKRISLNAEYESSLTPVSKTLTYKDNSYRFYQKSGRFILSLGYRFRFKKPTIFGSRSVKPSVSK